MQKRYYVIFGIFIYFMCLTSFKTSYAYSYKKHLIYTEDKEIITKELTNYINNIDNILIPTTSYNYSDILIENYDFLVRYAVNYVIDNKDKYISDIIKIDDNEYISKDTVYEITDKYFNIRDFYIGEDNILLEKINKEFKLKIKNIDYVKEDYIKVNVLYENNVKYVYVFTYDENNYMYLYNIGVVNEANN